MRFPKLATPLTAAAVVAPESVPPPGLLASATLTFPVKPVAVFSNASRAVSWTAGVMAAPAGVAPGCTVNTRCVAAAGAIVNAALVPASVAELARRV